MAGRHELRSTSLGIAKSRRWGNTEVRSPTQSQGCSLNTFRDKGGELMRQRQEKGPIRTMGGSRRGVSSQMEEEEEEGGGQQSDGGAARLLTCALTSTCPVLSSRLTISKFPILAA